jgi:proprotein convertase subtilisin/kexin type 5
MQTDAMCHSSCLVRQYGNTLNGTCDACPYDCLSCNSTGDCLSCDGGQDHRSLNAASHRCDCLSSYFDNHTTKCDSCPVGCASCTSLSFCLSCRSSYFLRSDSLCYSSCPPRFFGNLSILACDPCPYDCYTCDQNQDCLSCNASTDFRELNTYRCVPIYGYFESQVTVSSSCPSVCAACSSHFNCSACASGNYLRKDRMCYSFCLGGTYANS